MDLDRMQELGKMLEEVRSGKGDPKALALESTITQTLDMKDIEPAGASEEMM